MVRRVVRLVAVVLLFALVVSVIGFLKAPAIAVTTGADSSVAVRELTGLYPVAVRQVVTPRTVAEIAHAITSSTGPIAIGGGRYSMGGQTATLDGLQLDLREFTGIVALDTTERTITVHSGTTWRGVQQAIDPVGLSVKVMQTNNFTVGGALSVNAHGRYIGQGPLVGSVRSLSLVLANGEVVPTSPAERPELFYGAIGGYGVLGVIADVTLDLVPNVAVERVDELMPFTAYHDFFRQKVQPDSTVIFHNGDLYPPAYEKVHAVSYRQTDKPVTDPERIQPADQARWSHRTAYGIISGGRFGSWVREQVIDPWVFRGNPVTWRNYEASYDVSELEPASRLRGTFVLQEYFIPADSIAVFVPRMAQVLHTRQVNVVNVSIRHARPDPGTYLAWAPTEVFALVLYYKQGTTPDAQRAVGQWTRELIDVALSMGGRYYLPYQPHATRKQFHRAYPRADSLFALKRRVDPTNRFTNTLWDLYVPDSTGGAPVVTADHMPAFLPAEVRTALDTVPGYARAEASAYLTHPEWDLVYSSEAYARWLRSGKRPSQFPYITSVGTFWRGYVATWRATRKREPAGIGTHLMLGVIGMSTALEYGLKSLYENTIGWLAEWNLPAGGTAEDQYATEVAERYADLIVQQGWYEFKFGAALGHLWTDVPWFGPGILRKWERRISLSGEYGIKALYATVIGAGTATAYAADEDQRLIVAAGWSDSLMPPQGRRLAWLDRQYALVAVPRYTPYRDALLGLARHADRLRLAEISGNRVVTFTGTAPAAWQPPGRTSVVVAYGAPAEPGRRRLVLAVDVHDLLQVLAQLQVDQQMQVDHIYDY